jgi:hypothetical protein
MPVPGRLPDGATFSLETYMATTPDTLHVPPTAPSRPSKFMLLILAAVVVGFFAVVFTYEEAPSPSAVTAPAAAPQE